MHSFSDILFGDNLVHDFCVFVAFEDLFLCHPAASTNPCDTLAALQFTCPSRVFPNLLACQPLLIDIRVVNGT